MKDSSVYILDSESFSACFNPFKRTLAVFDMDTLVIEQDLTTPESVMLQLICDEHINGHLIISRSEIELTVWSDAKELDRSSNLNQLVSTLRKKLKSIFHKDVLITHPRKGYSLCEDITISIDSERQKSRAENLDVTLAGMDEYNEKLIDENNKEIKSSQLLTKLNTYVTPFLWLVVVVNIIMSYSHIMTFLSSSAENESTMKSQENTLFLKEHKGVYYLVCENSKGKFAHNLVVLSDVEKEKVGLLCTK